MSPRRGGRGYRYGRWHGGPDPLAPPYDLGNAVDEIGDSVLAGSGVREALRELLRRGTEGRRGLDDLRRSVRDRLRRARSAGRMDGTLEEVRELLERALEAERRELFPDPDDSARLAEAELDALPDDTAGAVRGLKDYPWRSEEGRQAYEQIQDLLRKEVLDSSFQGMKQALQAMQDGDGAAMQAVKDMVADLSALLDAHNRGEDTEQQFADFMAKHGQFFPDDPQSVEELIDSLARRAAAQERMLAGMSADQRAELQDLMAQAMGDLGLQSEMAHLSDALRQARPDLPWGQRGPVPDGEQPLGLGDATTAVADLADLESLSQQLSQGYAGASLADIDQELLEQALGRSAVDDLEALRRLERELERQGYLNRSEGALQLSPKAVRRLGATALRRVFAKLSATGRGEHDIADAGAAGELTGASREWRFGDEQPLDVVRTVRNAVLRTAGEPRTPSTSPTGHRAVRIAVDDFEVVETERRTGAAVALLVDLSYSMALRGTWGAAKSTAMALHSLVTTQFPQDAIEIIGFSSTAQVLRPETLAELSVDTLQGTNLQHGLMLARRFLARHRDAEPVVLVVTDGEPTAHLEDDGTPYFCWPPMPETIARTVAEVERVARSGATLNVFALDPEPALVEFVHDITARAGGRVFQPDSERLGEYVVADYLRARRGRRGGR